MPIEDSKYGTGGKLFNPSVPIDLNNISIISGDLRVAVFDCAKGLVVAGPGSPVIISIVIMGVY